MELRKVASWVVVLPLVLPCTAAQREDVPSGKQEPAEAAPAHPLAIGCGADVNRALRLARDRSTQASTVVEALVRIGPGLIEPALIAIDERKLPALDGGALQVLSDVQEARALDALRKMDPHLVWSAIDARLVMPDHGVPPLSTRAAAVLAAGTCASETELARLLACARCDASKELEDRIERAVRIASEDLFRREPGALTRLAETWRKQPAMFLPALVQAAGAGGDPRALRFLEQMLGQPGDLEKLALSQLTLQRAPAEATFELCEDLRYRLDTERIPICQAACTALGAIGDFGSVEKLCALLESDSEGLRANAYSALCTLSGLALPAQASSWRAWRIHESEWYDKNANAMAYAVEAGQKLQALNALTEIAVHRWERHALSDIVALALTRPEPEVVAKAREVLEQLGSPRGKLALAKKASEQAGAVAARSTAEPVALPAR